MKDYLKEILKYLAFQEIGHVGEGFVVSIMLWLIIILFSLIGYKFEF